MVEFDIDEDFEKSIYPNGLDEKALESEMKTDVFHEFFQGELTSFEAEGFVLENGKVIVKHKETY